MSVGEQIRVAREAKGWSQADLAKLAGCAQTDVFRVETGAVKNSKHTHNILAALGLAPVRISVPLVSWVSAGVMSFPDISDEIIGQVQESGLDPEGDWIALKVEGDSMDRISPPDSIIFVDRADKVLVPNACYVIANGDGEATYKRFRSNPMRFEPVSTNPAHEPIYPAREPLIVGRVKKSTIQM